MNNINISIENNFVSQILTQNLLEMSQKCENIAILCIGTDSNIGDSLAPLTGTLLRKKVKNVLIYGNLSSPITAKEVLYLENFIKNAHPQTKFIAIDAAVGKKEDIGKIKVLEDGIKPGLGVNKDLPKLGDLSIIGILSEKGEGSATLNLARISKVYKMAEIIADALAEFIEKTDINKKSHNLNVVLK